MSVFVRVLAIFMFLFFHSPKEPPAIDWHNIAEYRPSPSGHRREGGRTKRKRKPEGVFFALFRVTRMLGFVRTAARLQSHIVKAAALNAVKRAPSAMRAFSGVPKTMKV